MRATLLSLLSLMLFVPGTARADMTATYVAPNAAFTMKIEIASNGDVRGDAGQPGVYFITRAGTGYFVMVKGTQHIVMRVDDVATVMAEQMGKLDPKFREEMARNAPSIKLIAKGEVTINGRVGTAYFMQGADGKLSPTPVAVISKDPALAALGTAMARQFDMSIAGLRQIASTAEFGEMQTLLKSGAPLAFAGVELRAVDLAPIAASEFELPNPPETLDGVRAAMAAPAVRQ